jgi:hypothetical protein
MTAIFVMNWQAMPNKLVSDNGVNSNLGWVCDANIGARN